MYCHVSPLRSSASLSFRGIDSLPSLSVMHSGSFSIALIASSFSGISEAAIIDFSDSQSVIILLIVIRESGTDAFARTMFIAELIRFPASCLLKLVGPSGDVEPVTVTCLSRSRGLRFIESMRFTMEDIALALLQYDVSTTLSLSRNLIV